MTSPDDKGPNEEGSSAMLELRPICEHCARPLPPESTDAMICTFECTFCADCVETVIGNVCPTCGGGFSPRPQRPAHNWRGDNYTGAHPPRTTIRHRPVDPADHARFSAPIRLIAPADR